LLINKIRRRTLIWGPLLAVAFLSLGAVPREPPAVVALLLDTSGSIRPQELDGTKQLALGVFEALPPGCEATVFTFDDQPRLLLPPSSDVEEVRRALGLARIAGRYTALYDAIYDAGKYLAQTPAARKAILLVTDGRDENSTLRLEDGLKVAQEVPIPIFAIGVGHVDERVLRRIGKLTGGGYLPYREVISRELVSRILAVPESARASPGSLPSPSKVAPRPALPAASLPPRVGSTWTKVVVGAIVAGGGGLLAFGLMRRPRHRCPICQRELKDAKAACSFCVAAAPGRDNDKVEALSHTVLTRMNITEEYLEKTITLKEWPVLAITSGPGTGKVFKLSADSMISLGRAKANDIVLDDVAVSSQHCRVRPEDGRFVVHDLNSTNGTFVNERRITHHSLSEGDLIKVGETTLTFRRERQRV